MQDATTSTLAIQVALALGLDWCLGEVRRGHPLVAFGAVAARTEQVLRGDCAAGSVMRLRGVVAVTCLVAVPVAIVVWMSKIPGIGQVLGVLCLYLALGHRSLHEHGAPVAAALSRCDETTARRLAARMVSRDADRMHVSRATTESILENGSDAVFGALFWFLLAGAPGVVAYRLVNTLDAMWGYRNERFIDFGWAAARFDDLLNIVPARLTALSYALTGRTCAALCCAWRQGRNWDGPNAGVVMAGGAGALGVLLGGPCHYAGQRRRRPWLGCGATPQAADILRALALIRRSVWLWLGSTLFYTVLAGQVWTSA